MPGGIYSQGADSMAMLRDGDSAALGESDSTGMLHGGDSTWVGVSDSVSLRGVDSTALWAADTAGSLRWRQAAPGEMFGAQSHIVVMQHTPAPQKRPMTDYPAFEAFVLMLCVMYTMLLWRNWNEVSLLLTSVPRETAMGKRLVESPGSYFTRFLDTAAVIGALFAGVLAAAVIQKFIPGIDTGIAPQWSAIAISLGVSLVCLAVNAYQRAMLAMVGSITLTQGFISQIRMFRRIYFALVTAVAAPAIIFLAFSPDNWETIWFAITLAGIAMVALIYVFEVWRLFRSKNISRLHWFLYLCTVDIFPISLAWLVARRFIV